MADLVMELARYGRVTSNPQFARFLTEFGQPKDAALTGAARKVGRIVMPENIYARNEDLSDVRLMRRFVEFAKRHPKLGALPELRDRGVAISEEDQDRLFDHPSDNDVRAIFGLADCAREVLNRFANCGGLEFLKKFVADRSKIEIVPRTQETVSLIKGVSEKVQIAIDDQLAPGRNGGPSTLD